MPGIILWEGKSELDGKPIVLIAIEHSSNSKTGDMVQTYILRSDIHPVEAMHSGEDHAICGNCTHTRVQPAMSMSPMGHHKFIRPTKRESTRQKAISLSPDR